MSSRSTFFFFPLFIFFLFFATCFSQLTINFYDKSCPNLEAVIKPLMADAITKDPRMGASVLRLFFHDCFVQGCDASILLDDQPLMPGEKGAPPNAGSARGFDLIDEIKTVVEDQCPGAVSCADILAVAARDSVELLGGPYWEVKKGRRDAWIVNIDVVAGNLPSPTANLSTLIQIFSVKGLSPRDMVALSGAHTIGRARCKSFRDHVYNDTNIEHSFAKSRRSNCSSTPGSSDDNLRPMDLQTPDTFDNKYFQNLVDKKGLLHSDQELFNVGSTASQVITYATSPSTFNSDFVIAMIKMGDLTPPAGSTGEIRLNCRRIN